MAATGDAQYGEGYSSEVGSPGVVSRSKEGAIAQNIRCTLWAHFCEVRVDETLGQVRVSRWVVYTLVDASLTLRLHAAKSSVVRCGMGYAPRGDAYGCTVATSTRI